jgi:UTP--glucose-1-phosphate uridylyltransferase
MAMVNSRPQKVRKAVFPAAGLGTRFLPATKAQPKEMLPLVDKPIIQYVVEEAVASGLNHIIIVTGRGKNAIEDHFDVSYELERLLAERGKTGLLEQVRAVSNLTTVSYVRQGEALGLGHAVLMARDLVGNEPFAVLLGDDIIDNPVPCAQQMIDVFERHDAPVIAVQQVPRDEISAYGVIDGSAAPGEPRVYQIRDLVEKPGVEEAPSDLAIIGRYILTPDIFPILAATPRDGRGEIQLTNALRELGRRRPLVGYRFEGVRHDAGNKLGFLKATVEFALKRPDLGDAFRTYLRTLDL